MLRKQIHTPREKERIIDQKRKKETYTHTESEKGDMRFSFFYFWVLGFEEKGLGWFGRERF